MRIIFLFFFLCFVYCNIVFSADENTLFVINLKKKTDITKNIIYAPVFQLTWNILKKDILNGENADMFSSPVLASAFNKGIIKEEGIPEGNTLAYLVLGYKGEKIIETINQKNKKKFPDIKEIEGKFEPLDAVGYSLLYKEIIFKYGFKEIDGGIDFYPSSKNKCKVDAFGLEKYTEDNQWEIAKQIKILDYKNRDDFIISFDYKDKDNIMLAKIPMSYSIAKTLFDINKRTTSREAEYFKKGDSIAIPKIRFEKNFYFDEICKKSLLNTSASGWFFSEAITTVFFDMTNKNETKQEIKEIPMTANIRIKEELKSNRDFIFDRPFIVILKKKGSSVPYFILYVADIFSLNDIKKKEVAL